MTQLSGIRLAEARVFQEEKVVPIDAKLTVIMGRNNAGKSTVLRAPFLAIPNPNLDAPIPSYRRSTERPMDVALRFRFTSEELISVCGVEPRRILDVAVGAAGSALHPIVNHDPFKDWQLEPLVEMGWRWDSETMPIRTTRILGSDEKSYLEITDRGVSVGLIEGERVTSNAQPDWFAGTFKTLATANLPASWLAHWEHYRVGGVSSWISQSSRRVVDTEEERLQQTLTFLRMKYPKEFDRISNAMQRALPEFKQLEFIDVDGAGYGYRPGFLTAAGGRAPLAREGIGSGAWTCLCILTAARAAKATGARILFLDEPHLYMHPGMERFVINELMDETAWDDLPLQIIAATHSPTFVNAAVERGTLNILDWSDETRTDVSVTTISPGVGESNVFDGFVAQAGDLLYSDRIVFVEGPSDVEALQLLARERCGVRAQLRFVPLRETDAIGSEVARYFSIIVQSHGVGFQTRGLLVLDGDKKEALEATWGKLAPERDPRRAPGLQVEWSDPRGNDIESLFCEPTFLRDYFLSRGVPATSSERPIAAALGSLEFPARQRGGKGCTAVRRLHTELLGVEDLSWTKSDDLVAMLRFYISRADDDSLHVVRDRLAGLERGLSALATC